ncbi:hypothetical protein QYF61_016714 [Mycteria americana]|uniref:Reverse transcriptase domain-containing protein n=1 Tax=Mycteria americana TaxID=33587 RepID=A0AAN7NI06_MYCAM|nr:hypothetical protein QYF61_016714 [Mycteria americana]
MKSCELTTTLIPHPTLCHLGWEKEAEKLGVKGHLKDNIIIRHSQHVFIKGKSCLTNLVSYYDKVTCQWMKERQWIKDFDTVPHSNLLKKLSGCEELAEQQGLRVVVNEAVSGHGVPQGSTLGAVLFNIFINYLDQVFDDTYLGGAVDSFKGQDGLQRDLDRLEHWGIVNGMKFNKNKCDSAPETVTYKLGEEWLESSPAERDLGVLVDSRLNRSQQCALAAKGCILGCIKHSITSMSVLYPELMWPHFEYCVQFWAPQFQQDVKVFECVQRRATNLVNGLEGMSCEERLRTLHLSGEKEVEGIHGNGSKLYQGRIRHDIRKHFFTKRVIKHWNKLPREVVNAPRLNRLLQHGFLPQGHKFCQKTCSSVGSPLSTGPQVLPGACSSTGSPQGHSFLQDIHLLWRGVLHGLRVDICSTVALQGLQGDNLPHHGLHHGLQENLLWCLEYLLPLLLH